jgi:hypothetical protein
MHIMIHFCDHTQLKPQSAYFMLLKQHEHLYYDMERDL